MVREKYGVRLTAEQRNQLQHLVRAGKGTARVTVRARILLKTDEGWSAPQVAQALDVAEGTVFRIKRRFAEEGLEGVLQDRPQARRYRKLDDRGEAHLIALACSEPPEGHDHWTLRLLAGQVVELGLAGRLLSRYSGFLGVAEGDYEGAQQALGRAISIARREGDVHLEVQTLTDAAAVSGQLAINILPLRVTDAQGPQDNS